MITEQEIKIYTSHTVNPNIKWGNEFKPCSGVSDVDRSRHFDNLNEELLKRVRQVKAN